MSFITFGKKKDTAAKKTARKRQHFHIRLLDKHASLKGGLNRSSLQFSMIPRIDLFLFDFQLIFCLDFVSGDFIRFSCRL